MTATYTVFSSDDSSGAQRGLTLTEAADALLSTDDRGWEIRTIPPGAYGRAAGYRLWRHPFSRSSSLGEQPMVAVFSFYSSRPNYAAALRDILQMVVDDAEGWGGRRAMPDAAFAAMIAESAE